jgi:hypothetical protein
MTILEKINPVVDRKYLILLASVMWCGVGIMLIAFALAWLKNVNVKNSYLFYAAGFILAMPIHHFGFLKLADKNLRRLLPLTEKKCLFSFITWKSYITIIVMVILGITLRHSRIPKQYLSIIYNGLGLALFLSGIRYLRHSIRLMLAEDCQSDKKLKLQ